MKRKLLRKIRNLPKISSPGNIQANSLQQMTPKTKKLLIQTILRSLPIKLLKLRLKMQKRKKMPMNPRILKRLWTLHLNLRNKRYRSQ